MALSGLLKKASGVLQTLGIGDAMKFPGKDGDIVYSKNNVCVHPPSSSSSVTTNSDALETRHVPGYLTIYCQRDDVLGITLILQWLPNVTLEKNPRRIRNVSPRSTPYASQSASPHTRMKLRHLNENKKIRRRSSSETSSSPVHEDTGDSQAMSTPTSEPETVPNDRANPVVETHISVEMSGENLTAVVTAAKTADANQPAASEKNSRPNFLITEPPGSTLSAPSIQVIPNTPTPTLAAERRFETAGSGGDDGSPTTSGADDGSDNEDDNQRRSTGRDSRNSSPYTSGEEAPPDTPTAFEASVSALLMSFKNCDWLEKTPEDFAQSHNLMLPDGIQPATTAGAEPQMVNVGDDATLGDSGKSPSDAKNPCVFSVDLGQMRSLRLFYSNSEFTCGQLVIASLESQYKILHFHHGGLDKLAQIFEQWSVLRTKSKRGYDSPSSQQCRNFAVLRPELSKGEQHPEEGLYDRVSWEFWRMATSADGSIEDSMTIRKAVFFAGIEPSLRREAWPFLLHVYPWNSTREQREQIRNDLFLEYQNIRKRRLKGVLKLGTKNWGSVENTVSKDVVRTDRRNPYYKGDDNPNVETMRSVLLNYAAFCPQIGYIQGMSDLLAPILATVQEESDAFWCFAGLMQRTIFVSAPRSSNNMDCNLEYLRELLKLMHVEFYNHLQTCAGDALQLLFTHRWILLCFKREFPENDAFRIWEACWANYRTSYFHLFVCLAITIVYGQDVVQQKLPHDEILLYFSSLAMHMNADTVMKKARGLLYQFQRLEKVPCTLAGICDLHSQDMWDAGHQPLVECVQEHADGDVCPSLILETN